MFSSENPGTSFLSGYGHIRVNINSSRAIPSFNLKMIYKGNLENNIYKHGKLCDLNMCFQIFYLYYIFSRDLL